MRVQPQRIRDTKGHSRHQGTGGPCLDARFKRLAEARATCHLSHHGAGHGDDGGVDHCRTGGTGGGEEGAQGACPSPARAYREHHCRHQGHDLGRLLVREVLDVERLGQLEGVEDGLDLGLARHGEAELAASVLVGKGGAVFVLQQGTELGRGLGVALDLEQPALQVLLDGVLAAQDGVGGEAVVGAVADAFVGEVAENLAAGGVGVRVASAPTGRLRP